MTPAPTSQFWVRTISGLTLRINGVLWLERFSPGAFGTAVMAAIAMYALRRLQFAEGWGWAVFAMGWGAAATVAWLRLRGRWFTRTDARVLLEYRLRLDAGLTAAEAGLAEWPARVPLPPDLLRWRSATVIGWLGAAVALVIAGAWLPVPALDPWLVRPVDKPPALVQTEDWLEALSKLDVVEPASVDPLVARAEELSRQSPENQYTHAGLEAADALREQTSAAMQGLAQALENASAALAPLEQAGATLTSEQLKSVGERMDAALRGLREGSLTARADLLKACEAGAANPLALSAAQAAQLRQGLAQAGKQVRGVRGAEGAGTQIGGAAGLTGLALIAGQVPGQGGVGRGPGEAPLSFSDTASDTGPGKAETVANHDLSRAALGDLLGTQTGEHELDPTRAQGVTAAGSPGATAAGGDAVWVNRLTPAERAALSTFFK